MEAVRKFPELFEVVGFAEENEEWLKKRGDLPAYKGLKRLSVDEIIEKSDAILVECDVWNLTATAQKCIDAGKHIHLDKPASGTLTEYKHLLDTAREKNLTLQLGYMYRYNPAIKKAFELIKNGELGEIYSINAEMSTRHSDEFRIWLNHFGGGNMYIFGSHLIDLIVLLLGKPKKVSSHIGNSNMNGISAPDLTSASLIYDNSLARVFVSSVEVNGWGRRCLSVAGSKGTLELRPIETPEKMTLAMVGEGKEYFDNYAKEIELPHQDDDCRYDEMIKDLYDFITGKKQNPFTYEHEYAVQEVLDKVVGGVKASGNNSD
jgi:predicted dehydrogenase